MAEVYLAEQGSLRRQVALKVLRLSLASDESYVRRFHKEAQAAASLVQSNIVQIYEVGRAENLHFIAQEYVPGKNLKQVLDRKGALDVGTTVSIIRQVGAALHRAAQAGITHRDIKPENIMLTAGGEVKVADFGLARVTGNGEAVDVTQVGMTMGTPLYMSPEQIEGRPVDPRSDLYSLGITCYQMLAGRPPFGGETALGIAVQHIKNEAEPLKKARTDLPEGLCRIVHKLMSKKPEQRYQSAAEMLRDLRGLAIEADSAEWPSGLDQWSTSEMLALSAATQQLEKIMRTGPKPAGKRFGLAALAVAAILLCFGAGAVLAWFNRPESYLKVDPQQLPKIERRESPESQYAYAMFLGSERGWRSVWQHFPPELSAKNAYYTNRAKERLAELYLREDQPDLALQLYEELEALHETEEEFRLRGVAGQAICYDRLKDAENTRKYLSQLLDPEKRRRLLNDETRRDIERLLDRYRPAGQADDD